MSRIFYYGADDKIYGPVTEQAAQSWYSQAFLYSDVRFQISPTDKSDPNGKWTTLGQLIEQNGQFAPFHFSPDRERRTREKEEEFNQLKKEVESMRQSFKDTQRKSNEKISEQSRQIASLVEELKTMREAFKEALCKSEKEMLNRGSQITSQIETTVLNKVSALVKKKENLPGLEKQVTELKKKMDDQEKVIGFVRKELAEVDNKYCVIEARLDDSVMSIQQILNKMELFQKFIEQMDAWNQTQWATKHMEDQATDRERKKLDEVSKLQIVQGSLIAELTNKIFALKTSDDSTKDILNALETSVISCSGEIQEIRADLRAPKKAQQPESEAVSQCDLPGSSEKKPATVIPPWEKMLSKDGTAKHTNKTAEQAPWENDQKTTNAADTSNKKAPEAAKPVSRVKDWDAICRDLSDDEEEEEIKINESTIELPKHALAKSIVTFVHDIAELLNTYCAALDADCLDPIKTVKAMFDLGNVEEFFLSPALAPGTEAHLHVRDMLLKELRRLASKTVVCSACNFQMVVPRHMFYHLAHTAHVNRETEIGADFTKISTLIAQVLVYFIDRTEMERSMASEEAALQRDNDRYIDTMSKFTLPSRYRPLPQFMELIVTKVTSLTPSAKNQHNRATTPIAPGQLGMKKKEVIGTMRKWLAEEKNRKVLSDLVESHLEEGVPMCGCCVAVFATVEEYYQHMTSYSHACRDQSMYSTIFWLWKGGVYWNGMM